MLHPLEEADVISTLNQQSARAVGEAPRGEKSIKCPTNDVAFLLPLFFTLRPRYSPSRPVYIPGTPSGALSVPMHWFSLVTDFKPFVEGSKHIWQPSGVMIMQRWLCFSAWSNDNIDVNIAEMLLSKNVHTILHNDKIFRQNWLYMPILLIYLEKFYSSHKEVLKTTVYSIN